MRVQLGLPKLKPLGIPNGNGCNLVVATNASLRAPTFFDSQQLSSTNPPTSPTSIQNQFSMATIPYKEQLKMSWLAYSHPKIEFFFHPFSDPEINEILGIPGIVTAPPGHTAVDFYTAESNPPTPLSSKKLGSFRLGQQQGTQIV